MIQQYFLFVSSQKRNMQKKYVKPFYWASEDYKNDKGEETHRVIAFAHELGKSKAITLHVADFQPWIHIVLKGVERKSGMVIKGIAKEVFESLKKKLEKDSHEPVKYELSMRLPYYYYTDRKELCMKLHFKTSNAARHCGNLMKWPIYTKNYGKIKCLYVEDRIGNLERFHAENGIQTTSWIRIQPIRAPEHLKVSEQPDEYYIHMEDIETLDDDTNVSLGQTYPNYLVYDHEMMSHRKYAFPDELNADDPIFMTGVLHIHHKFKEKEVEKVIEGEKFNITVKEYEMDQTIDEYCLCYHKTLTAKDIGKIPGSELVREGPTKYDVLTVNNRTVKLLWYDNEIDLITGWENLIREKDPDALIGHNSNSFDMPYHKVRKARLFQKYTNMSRMKDWNQGFRHIEWSSSAYKDIFMDVPDGHGRIYFDTMLMKKREYIKDDSYGLDHLAQKYMGIGKHEWTPQQIFDSFAESDPEKMRKTIIYCMRDVWCTWGLFNHLNFWLSYNGMSKVMGVEIFDLFAQGQGIRTRTQIFKECFARGYYLFSPERPLQRIAGAHVFETHVGLHEYMLLLDFAGLYPSIMMQYNIGNDTFDKNDLAPPDKRFEFKWNDEHGDWHTKFVKKELRKGLIPCILERLKDARTEAKKKMKECAKKGDFVGEAFYDILQNAYKISMNSIYGALGQAGGYLGLEEAGATITALGRMLVKKIAKWAEEQGWMVVYGDTDSIMIKRKEPLNDDEKRNFDKIGKDMCKRLNAELFADLPYIRVELDGCFRTFLALSKKMYAYTMWDPKNPLGVNKEKAKSKGLVTSRRDTCLMMRRLYKKLYTDICAMEPLHEIIGMLAKELQRLLYGELDVEEMITIKSLGADYASESNAFAVFSRHLRDIGLNPKPGDRLPYVMRKLDNFKTSGEKYEDPDVFLREGYEYDRSQYLKSQFANKLDDILHKAYPKEIPEKFIRNLDFILSTQRKPSVLKAMIAMMQTHMQKQ